MRTMMILAAAAMLAIPAVAQTPPIGLVPADVIWVAGPEDVAPDHWVFAIGDIPLNRQGPDDWIVVYQWWIDPVTGAQHGDEVWGWVPGESNPHLGGMARSGTKVVAWFRAPENPADSNGNPIQQTGLHIWYAANGVQGGRWRTTGPKVSNNPVVWYDGFVSSFMAALRVFWLAATGGV